MAQLILTDEEKTALTWLDVPDDTLGKIVKKTCLVIKEMPDDATEMQKVWQFTAAIMLCNHTIESNAEEAKFIITGLTYGDKQNGDWEVIIRKK